MGFLIQTHDCSNANNKMLAHFNECLHTNSTIIIVSGRSRVTPLVTIIEQINVPTKLPMQPLYPLKPHDLLFHLSVSGRPYLDGSFIHQPIFWCSSHYPDTCPHTVLHILLPRYFCPFTLPSSINFSSVSCLVFSSCLQNQNIQTN